MSQSLYFINHNNKEFTLDKFLKKLENLAYTTAWAIMFELEVRLFADTTQSRLRREGKDIKPMVTWGTSPQDVVTIEGTVPDPTSYDENR